MWRLARRGAPLPARDTPRPEGKVPPWENIGVIYHYHDADGDLVLDVVRTRTGTPRFVQRAPDGHRDNGEPKWRWSVEHIPNHDCLLYRLPGLRASGDATVWITEGEKDADRLHDEGLIATTNIGGAGKWRHEYAEEFRGKHCVILQDNDKAGRDHTDAVARSLSGIAASVKVLLLPGLPEKGDVSDWLDDNGTVEDLERLAREAQEYRQKLPPAPDGEVQIVRGTIRPLTTIPPRQWAYGKFLLFGSAACIGGMDGAGKGMLATAMALAMITGYPLLGEKVWRTGPVAIITYEDDQDEWERRIAAACLHYSQNGYALDYETLIGSFYFLHKPGGRVTLAERTKENGLLFPDTARIVHFLKEIGAVMLIIDPFNSAHAMEDGNNNVAIAAVAQEITSHRAAGPRRRPAAAPSPQGRDRHHRRPDGRGRAARQLPQRAHPASRERRRRPRPRHPGRGGVALPVGRRHERELRTAARLERMWFHKASEKLNNPAGIYKLGDEVGAIERWNPPAAFEGMDYASLRAVFDALAAGPHSRGQAGQGNPVGRSTADGTRRPQHRTG